MSERNESLRRFAKRYAGGVTTASPLKGRERGTLRTSTPFLMAGEER
jgi:hypothetical protein